MTHDEITLEVIKPECTYGVEELMKIVVYFKLNVYFIVCI
jgi:hypothetical protein